MYLFLSVSGVRLSGIDMGLCERMDGRYLHGCLGCMFIFDGVDIPKLLSYCCHFGGFRRGMSEYFIEIVVFLFVGESALAGVEGSNFCCQFWVVTSFQRGRLCELFFGWASTRWPRCPCGWLPALLSRLCELFFGWPSTQSSRFGVMRLAP